MLSRSKLPSSVLSVAIYSLSPLKGIGDSPLQFSFEGFLFNELSEQVEK